MKHRPSVCISFRPCLPCGMQYKTRPRSERNFDRVGGCIVHCTDRRTDGNSGGYCGVKHSGGHCRCQGLRKHKADHCGENRRCGKQRERAD